MRTFIDHSALITVGRCLNGSVKTADDKAKIEECGKTFLDFAVNIVFSDNIYLSWYENRESVLNDSDWAMDKIQRIIPNNTILPVGKSDDVFGQIFVDNCLNTAKELAEITGESDGLVNALNGARVSKKNFIFAPMGYSEDKINALHKFLYDVAKYPSPPADNDEKPKEIEEELLAAKNDLMPLFMILKTPKLYAFLHDYMQKSVWSGNKSGILEHYFRSLVYGRLPGYLSETSSHKGYKIGRDLSRTIEGIRKDENIFYWPNTTRIRALSHWTNPVIKAIQSFAEERGRAQTQWTTGLKNNGEIARQQIVCELRNAFLGLRDVSPEAILKYAVELREVFAPFRKKILTCDKESCIREVLEDIFAKRRLNLKEALQGSLNFFTLFNVLASLAAGLNSKIVVAAGAVGSAVDYELEWFRTKKVINAKIGFQKIFDAARYNNEIKFQEFCRKL